MKTLILRFQKFDKFGNPVFCASGDNINNPEEAKSFQTLSEWYDKLQAKNYNTFLPIYSMDKFSSIRLKPNNKFSMSERNLYTVDFNVRVVERDGKTYVNCYIEGLKLFRRCKPIDKGEVVDLDL